MDFLVDLHGPVFSQLQLHVAGLIAVPLPWEVPSSEGGL